MNWYIRFNGASSPWYQNCGECQNTNNVLELKRIAPKVSRVPTMMTSSNGNIFRVTPHLCGESPHKGQWRGAFMLICACINGWVNNRKACDLRRHLAHYDMIVMDETNPSNQVTERIPRSKCDMFRLFFWCGIRTTKCVFIKESPIVSMSMKLN